MCRWFSVAGDVKLLQTLLIQGQGWVRGYAAAALVECIKTMSGSGVSVASCSNGSGKDVDAVLSSLFDVFVDEKASDHALTIQTHHFILKR